VFLGIDTSAYTTSLAILSGEGKVIADSRILLPVPAGEKGLQQSSALFLHLHNLPGMIEKVFQTVRGKEIRTVAVSGKPRPLPGSYMPVFVAGKSLASALAAAWGVPLVETSHQEGHLAAGLWSARAESLERFLAVHLSGGTSELLLVEKKGQKPLEFSIRVLGAALDISAGQLIDRVGVAMGLPFPAGSALEKLAQEYCEDAGDGLLGDAASLRRTGQGIIPSAVRGYNFSFSGPETRAIALLRQGVPPGEIARGVEHCVALTVEKVLRKAIKDSGIREVLIAGGVAANGYLRNRLIKRLEHRAIGAKLISAAREYSSDNAVGVAVIARSLLEV
jgi:N6-L-threonylcarbamoyladenine synthase